MKDYYTILGVAKNASDEDIKRAYRRMASQHHPDKGGDKARFQEVQEAYSVLGDSAKRAEYDNPAQRININMGGRPTFNLDEIFQMFQMGGQHHHSHARISLWIDLEDVARGGPRTISVQVGSKVSSVEIEIPQGIADGDTIRYPRLGPDQKDLIINYRIKPHKVYQRDGRDIIAEMQIPLWDLLLGTEIAITDLVGVTLMITVPPNTQPNSLLRARGRGLPPTTIPGRAGGPPGDLLVKVQAKIPKDISEELLAAIRKERGH